MWELDYKESWVLKNWCFWTVVLDSTLESPLDCKDIQPVHPKGDQSWVFIGRTGVEAATPILWSPDVKKWLIWKDPDAGRDWGQEEKGTTEDEMVGWHHWLNGHGFGWTLGVGDGLGGLVCCGSGCQESDTTGRMKWNELNWRSLGDLKFVPISMSTEKSKHFPPDNLPKMIKCEMISISCVTFFLFSIVTIMEQPSFLKEKYKVW